MNTIVDCLPMSSIHLQPYQLEQPVVGGSGVERFISTSRNDKEITVFLNQVFEQAAEEGASDIHIADDEYGAKIRFRTNGILRTLYRITREASLQIDGKIRARCQMSQSDRDTPFDGSFWFSLGDRLLDLRVSIMPTRLGQSIVCRLLDQSNASRTLGEIDMPDLVRRNLEKSLTSPEGLVLVTGPTGSGKTSTLYACLNTVNTPEIHIVTAEDPVEYRLVGANQVNVHASRTFAKILRSFLRQDFDIGLVGEIRDSETAVTAFQAANTGHLMLSTLHANDTVSSISRLVDLGVDTHTIAAATQCVIAQRLTNRLCPHCSTPRELDDGDRDMLGKMHFRIDEGMTFWCRNRQGCDLCREGEKGRIAVFEMLMFTRELKDAIVERDPRRIKEAAMHQPQFNTITQAALHLCTQAMVDFDRAIGLSNG